MVLSKGEIAPNFDYINDKGEVQNFHDVAGKKIVFFFPKAFTTSCTKEACSLQESYEDLKQDGITEIFGISMDSREKQLEFMDQYNLEYIMVDDEDGEISKSYGVFTRKLLLFKFSARYTFIVDGNNTISAVFENGLRGDKSELGMERHGEELLNFINMDPSS